jgi:hypothetical protein
MREPGYGAPRRLKATMSTLPRSIRPDEARIIRVVLDRAARASFDPALPATVASLVVVGRCACGCPTIDFASAPSDVRSTVLADATGAMENGEVVGVMVWGRSDAITGLEVFDFADRVGELGLPTPESIIRWRGMAGSA